MLSRQALVFGGVVIIIAVGLATAAWWLESVVLSWALSLWIGLALIAALGLRISRRSTSAENQKSGPNANLAPHVRDGDRRLNHDPRARPRVSYEDPPVLILPPEPDLAPLLAVIDQHREVYARHAERLAARGEDLEPQRQGVRDAFAWNLDQIRPYLDEVLAREDPERLTRLSADVDRAAELLTLGPWCVGYAFLRETPSASTLLLMSRGLSPAALPVAQRDLVEPAIANAHRLFVSIFNGYYASEHGRSVRRQRDGHLLDVYGAFTHAAMKCFQLGLDPTLLD